MKTLSTLIVAVSLLAGSSIASAEPVTQKDPTTTASAIPPSYGVKKSTAPKPRTPELFNDYYAFAPAGPFKKRPTPVPTFFKPANVG